ncbi:methyltransferase domain-containing protein [Halostella sp. JP-L12]|uniref:methyltransferase domain-containing protein n=1 Tax=Halostella TaxID=1843185 RepID=UPI000EF797E2|nr:MULTISPECIES: methyltransferase domain-containing protein [Halostella]NHN46025.1 methyltransferase domain-containing protein [Halostella sp. JP-L12]
MYVLELGGEDDAFAAREAASAATGVSVVGPGLATASALAPDRVRTLAYTHRACEVLGRSDASVAGARALLSASSLDRDGTVAVRARDVRGSSGVDTQAVERELGGVLVDRGFDVDLDDPDHELRALFARGEPSGDADAEAADVCYLGWLTAESVRDYGDRTPTNRPFFQPGSMDPLLARALANVAGAAPGRTVLDPMCGTGGVLIEAGLVGARVLGNDAQRRMVRGSRENLRAFLGDGAEFGIVRGDATRLPFPDGSVDADERSSSSPRSWTVDGVVFDAPYGRQSKIATHDLDDLVAGALSEARRLAPRTVMVADRSWAGVARDAGWEIESSFERRVHRSLTRHVLVLE